MVKRRQILTSSLLLAGCSYNEQNNPYYYIAENKRYYILIITEFYKGLGLKISEFIEVCIGQGFREFYFIISSHGGYFYDALGLYNFLMKLREKGDVNIITHNVGHVESAADYVFLAGQTRIMNKNSSFLFHSAATLENLTGSNADKMNLTFSNFNQIGDIGHSIVKHSTKIPENKVIDFEYNRREYVMGPDDALQYGVVSLVKDFTAPAEVPLYIAGDQNNIGLYIKIGPHISVKFYKPTPPMIDSVPGPQIGIQFYI